MADSAFRWDVPSSFNFARDVIDALGIEDRLGLVFVNAAGAKAEYTFGQIADASQRWAAVLRDAGVKKGDRVIIVLPKVPDWLFAMTALLRIGAVAVPGAEQLRAKDMAFRASHSGATTVIAHRMNVAEVETMRADSPTIQRWLVSGGTAEGWLAVDPLIAAATPWLGEATVAEDMAYIVYTSGTTKDPKGVVHNVAYTYAKRMQAAYWFDVKSRDLVWSTAGTGWAKSLWNVLLGPWSCGASIVLHEGGFKPEERMDMIRDLGVTVLCQAPTEYRLLAKLPDLGTRWRLPLLRHCVSAGEPLNPEVLLLWKDAFKLTILDGYGQTENSLLVANAPGMDVRPGSMGKPTPGHDIAVTFQHFFGKRAPLFVEDSYPYLPRLDVQELTGTAYRPVCSWMRVRHDLIAGRTYHQAHLKFIVFSGEESDAICLRLSTNDGIRDVAFVNVKDSLHGRIARYKTV